MINDDINFAYDFVQTPVYRSCAATLNGEMFILGGPPDTLKVNTQNLETRTSIGKNGTWLK